MAVGEHRLREELDHFGERLLRDLAERFRQLLQEHMAHSEPRKGAIGAPELPLPLWDPVATESVNLVDFCETEFEERRTSRSQERPAVTPSLSGASHCPCPLERPSLLSTLHAAPERIGEVVLVEPAHNKPASDLFLAAKSPGSLVPSKSPESFEVPEGPRRSRGKNCKDGDSGPLATGELKWSQHHPRTHTLRTAVNDEYAEFLRNSGPMSPEPADGGFMGDLSRSKLSKVNRSQSKLSKMTRSKSSATAPTDVDDAAAIAPPFSDDNDDALPPLPGIRESSIRRLIAGPGEHSVRRLVSQGGSIHRWAEFLLRSLILDNVTMLLIVANAVMTGVQTDSQVRNQVPATPNPFRAADIVFCICFTLEIAFRIFVLRWNYFTASDRYWNYFDCLLVTLQIMEESLALIMNSGGVGFSVSFLRSLRIMRLMRLVRVIRLFRFFSDLRTIIMAVAGSLKPLISSLALLFLLIYTAAVFLTQVVHVSRRAEEPLHPQLEVYFGSVPRAIMCLWQAVSGGIDWGDIATPLVLEVSWMAGLFLALFVAFTMLAIMNIVTGVFVEAAMRKGKEDQDHFLINNVKELFKSIYFDSEGPHGQLSWEDFERHLDDRVMREYFRAVDLDHSEAKGLFSLLDIDGNGSIDVNEFLCGCLRLRGPAKSLDMQILMREQQRTSAACIQLLENMSDRGEKKLENQISAWCLP